MKLLLIVNSSASSVTARARVVIAKALAADHDVTVAETSRRGHAQRLALGAAAAGTEVVAVLGGDGTLNEAANGLAGTSCALAVLPGGSTNVFARTLGLPNDPIEATGDLVGALARGAIEPVSLGSVNGRYFLFHVGLGFDAAVVAQVERRSHLKRYLGHPLFVFSAFSAWSGHVDRTSPPFAVHLPNGEVVDGHFTVVLNTNPYTYLGDRALPIAPDASLDRPLATVTLRSLDLSVVLRAVASALGSGTALRSPSSSWSDYRVDLTDFSVVGHRPFPYQVDGDYLGEVESLVFRHEPDVLHLARP